MKIKYITRPVFFFTLFFILNMLSGCNRIVNSPPEFPYILMLSIDEVPFGWNRLGGIFPDEPGALISHATSFSPYKNPPYWINISHTITVYPDLDTATTAYTNWEQRYYTEVWQAVQDTNFHPVDSEDIFRFEYWDVQIDEASVRSYTYLQQHGNLIILILANVDNQKLTFAQFEEILSELDAKLQNYQLPASPISFVRSATLAE